AWIYVVHLSAQTDPALRDELLDEEMVVCAQQCIDEHLYPDENVSKIVKINPNFLYDNCLREIYPTSGLSEAGKDVYARLEFGKTFREEIDRDYRQIMAQSHINILSGIVVAGLVSLGGLYSYLRSTTPKAVEV